MKCTKANIPSENFPRTWGLYHSEPQQTHGPHPTFPLFLSSHLILLHFIPLLSLLSHHPFCSAHSYLSRCEGWKRYYYGVSGWREETGVATRIAWGERGANDGRTGLVSGLWYLLDVIDGEQRGKRRRAGNSFSACTFYFIVSRKRLCHISAAAS